VIFRIYFILLFSCFLFSTYSVSACDCKDIKNSGDSLVFFGKALDISNDNVHSGLKITFGLEKLYKGQSSGLVVISTPYPDIDCGFDFKKDSLYLVYAFRKRSIKTNICTPTQLISDTTNLKVLMGNGFAPYQDQDKIWNSIVLLIIVTLAGFILLAIILFARNKQRKKTGE